MISNANLTALRSLFAERFLENISLKRYTAARLGGKADYSITVESAGELAKAAALCWENEIPFIVLGSGSNVLVSDRGVRQLVLLNHARKISFDVHSTPTRVIAESGANLGALARRAAARGLSGLEWADGIPGTVGGAVYGNAGAHGSDMNSTLLMANILHLKPSKNGVHHEISTEEWLVEELDYGYRSSSFKREPGSAVVLSAILKLQVSTLEAVRARMEEFRVQRHASQPPGASLGSIFKNPTGDYAGRLIEAAGLKGRKIGQVEVSSVHANFFINLGDATASDYADLVRLVQQVVFEKSGIMMEPEIELIGDWSEAKE